MKNQIKVSYIFNVKLKDNYNFYSNRSITFIIINQVIPYLRTPLYKIDYI